MNENYESEYRKIVSEYDAKCKAIELKNPDMPNRLDGRKELDSINKWFLIEKNKLIKKYNKSTQRK